MWWTCSGHTIQHHERRSYGGLQGASCLRLDLQLHPQCYRRRHVTTSRLDHDGIPASALRGAGRWHSATVTSRHSVRVQQLVFDWCVTGCCNRVRPRFTDGCSSSLFAYQRLWKKHYQLQLPGVVDIVFVVMLVVSVAVRLDWIRNSSSSAIDPVWQLDHYPENFEHVATLFTRSITVDGFCAVFSVLLLVRFTRYISRRGPVVNTVLTSIPLGTALVVLAAALIAPWVPQPFLVIGSSVSNRFLNRMQHSCWGSLAPSTSDPSPRRTTTASRIKY
jgi:hypothetical protein